MADVIAIDADDMDALSQRLSDASTDVGGAVPALPGGAAFGPQVLVAAVQSFGSAVGRDAQDLHDRWAALDTGVRGALDDMNELETGVVAALKQLQEPLA